MSENRLLSQWNFIGKAQGPRSGATSSPAFIDGAVIAWSKNPSDVWQVLNFLAVYIAAVTDTLRPRSCCPANHITEHGAALERSP
jgi:hypothetical protein